MKGMLLKNARWMGGAALLGAALLGGCVAVSDDDDAAPACAPEELLDDEGRCVPEACGAGPWGSADLEGGTVYVAPWGDRGAAGDRDAPLDSVAAGADLAGARGGRSVAIAAGLYEENIFLQEPHVGVQLRGRCAALVELRGDPSQYPTLEFATGSMGALGLRISGGDNALQVATRAGFPPPDVVLRDLELMNSQGAGLLVAGVGARVNARGLYVHDIERPDVGTGGHGVAVQGGATLELEQARIVGWGGVGISISGAGTDVRLNDVLLEDPGPAGDLGNGRGISLRDGAELEATNLRVHRAIEAGVVVSGAGSRLLLRGSEVLDSQTFEGQPSGRGIVVQDGAEAELTDVDVRGSAEVGVLARGEGSALSLIGVTITGGRPLSDGTGGRGLVAQSDALVDGEDVLIEDNRDVGVLINRGSRATLRRLVVRDTSGRYGELLSHGVLVQEGGTLIGEDLEIVANEGHGVEATGDSHLEIMDALIGETRPDRVGWGGVGLLFATGSSGRLERVTIEDSSGVGVFVTDHGTSVVLVDSTISATRRDIYPGSGLGLAINSNTPGEGPSVSAQGLRIESNAAVGAYVVGPNARFDCDDCALVDNRFAALLVGARGAAQLRGGQLLNTLPHPSRGGGVGVFVWDEGGPARLDLEGVEIGGQSGPALYLRGRNSVQVRGSLLDAGSVIPVVPALIMALDGSTPWSEDTEDGLLIQGNELRALSGTALLLHAASGTVDGNSADGDTLARIHQQGCATVPPPVVLGDPWSVDGCDGSAVEVEPRLWFHAQASEIVVAR